MQKSRYVVAAVMLCVLFGFVAAAFAQWDETEEQQRVENKQWDRTMEQNKQTEKGPLVIKEDDGITRGEKRLMELSNIPTGYLCREFFVRQNALRGSWGHTQLVPAEGYEDNWGYVDNTQYRTVLGSGITDDKIKGTADASFYSDMKKACSRKIAAKGDIHVRVTESAQDWITVQNSEPPHDILREIPFQCLAEGERK